MEPVKLKVCVVGNSNVGKTCLIRRLIFDAFSGDEPLSSTFDIVSKQMEVRGQPYQLFIWDTVGQERFHALNRSFYHDARSVLIVYDVTAEDPVGRVRYWVSEIQQAIGNEVCLVVAGNKVDLPHDPSEFKQEVDDFTKEIGATHLLTSAKTGTNVEDMFVSAVPKEKPKMKSERSRGETIAINQAKKEKEQCC